MQTMRVKTLAVANCAYQPAHSTGVCVPTTLLSRIHLVLMVKHAIQIHYYQVWPVSHDCRIGTLSLFFLRLPMLRLCQMAKDTWIIRFICICFRFKQYQSCEFQRTRRLGQYAARRDCGGLLCGGCNSQFDMCRYGVYYNAKCSIHSYSMILALIHCISSCTLLPSRDIVDSN